jgi:hypothetical protein
MLKSKNNFLFNQKETTMVNAQKLKDKLEEKYGSLDDESGCYVNNDWLSVKDVVDLIDECDDGDDD